MIAPTVQILCGDNRKLLRQMPGQSVHCVVTSPPYFGQRDYGVEGQIGREETSEQYIETMVKLFRKVRRVLRDDGTLWLNLGDKYASNPAKGRSGRGKNSEYLGGVDETQQTRAFSGLVEKNLLGMPWRVALALQADGWVLRSDIIWHKPNAMPGSQRDRCTVNHEYLFMLAKQPQYYFDDVAIRERAVIGELPRNFGPQNKDGDRGDGNKRDSYVCDGYRLPRSVWSIPVASERESHFAVFPPRLVLPCIKAGTSQAGCCPQCLAHYRRVTERLRKPTRPGKTTKVTGDAAVDGNRDPLRHVTEVRTVGWEPSCGCDAGDAIPCTVLDPFMGSGTVAAVAVRKNRSAVGIELNPEYVEIIKRKVRKAQLKKGFGL